MSKSTLFKKVFVVTVIVLFIGTCFVSSIGGNAGTLGDISNFDIKENKSVVDIEKREIFSCDSSENSEWYRTFGGGETDIAECLIQTSDGGYLITGATWSYGAGFSDAYLLKTDESGNEIWNKTYGGMEEDGGHCVIETFDGSYIITGCTRSFGNGLEDVWLIKTDEYGNEIWNKTFGGKNVEWGKCVMEVHKVVAIVAEKLRKISVDVFKDKDIEVVVQNMVATSDLGAEFNMNEVAVGLGLENVEYEPEQFPGLVYRVKEPKAVILIFNSGRIVCVGARSTGDISKAVGKLSEKLARLGFLV